MRPGGTLLKGAGLLTGLGLASALVPSVTPVWWAVLALLTLLAIADGVMGAARPRITGERHLKERYALGVAETVTLVVHLPGRLGARVTLLDGSPAEVKTEDMPWVGYSTEEAGPPSRIRSRSCVGDGWHLVRRKRCSVLRSGFG
ncbi:MAG: hypothetical protein R3F31_03795 [Verrucomicrobiales bacterium]